MLGLVNSVDLPAAPVGKQLPNIVIVYADDLGYGDVNCYDPEFCAVPTPHIDRLADEGMRFTDASNSASLCSPARYSLLTGRYSWRSRLKRHVVRAYGSPLIENGRLTLPEMLRRSGYFTVCIGKWHLGWNWPIIRPDGSIELVPEGEFLQDREGNVDFSLPIGGGPLVHGFDSYFGIDVPNYPPYVYIRNDRVTSLPNARKGPSTPERWGPDGPMQPGYRFDEVMPNLVEEAEQLIAEHAGAESPFFLYFPLTTPHEPIAPSAAFRGKSGISGVADLIMETDAALGAIMAALETHGIAGNTILIFSSDNGHASYTPLRPFLEAAHRVNGPFRGYKAFVQEGGMRVPLIVRWPGVIPRGAVSDAMVNTTDLMATCAELVEYDLPPDAGEDSYSMLPVWLGKAESTREVMVTHAYLTEVRAIRRDQWKLAFAYGSGAWNDLRVREEGVPPGADAEGIAREKGNPPIQLYELERDPGELTNLQGEYPDVVKALSSILEVQVEIGRSTPLPMEEK